MKPLTVPAVKLTMMPMETGSGFASSVSDVAVPVHASVSVAGSAARAVIDRPATIAVRAELANNSEHSTPIDFVTGERRLGEPFITAHSHGLTRSKPGAVGVAPGPPWSAVEYISTHPHDVRLRLPPAGGNKVVSRRSRAAVSMGRSELRLCTSSAFQ